jgi:glycosyltransferase involved in cell wall biosynthesis
MASGVPTIAFDCGAARAHLRDREHGRLVPSGDNAAFALAAVDLAGDDERRRLMGIAARRAVQPLRPERVARDFVGVLATLTA